MCHMCGCSQVGMRGRGQGRGQVRSCNRRLRPRQVRMRNTRHSAQAFLRQTSMLTGALRALARMLETHHHLLWVIDGVNGALL